MKTKPFIRNLLGLTQLEMAMLLRISRSQYSMYELGRRDLPLHAQQRLTEILTHVKGNEMKSQTLPVPTPQQLSQQHKQLTRLLRENEFQQLVVSRKIAEIEERRTERQKLLPLVDFLNVPVKDSIIGNELCQNLIRKVFRAPETEHMNMLELELKQAVLNFEKILLGTKMNKIESKD